MGYLSELRPSRECGAFAPTANKSAGWYDLSRGSEPKLTSFCRKRDSDLLNSRGFGKYLIPYTICRLDAISNENSRSGLCKEPIFVY